MFSEAGKCKAEETNFFPWVVKRLRVNFVAEYFIGLFLSSDTTTTLGKTLAEVLKMHSSIEASCFH